MCGIAGFYHVDRRPSEVSVLERMARSIRHRGPDDTGTFVAPGVGLVHTRLSIIDLATGNQPMLSDDGKTAIVFNGEIYNYLELRQRLLAKGISFKTQSDTEVLLKLYLEEGEACLQSLNGMFAFIIWDERQNRIFGARDRLGIKPLYYHWDGKTFVFGSEIKALFASGLVKPSLNSEGLEDYLAFQFCLGPRTLFRDVKRLEPGECFSLTRDGRFEKRTYWSLDQLSITHFDEDEAASRLLRLLEDAVRLQLRADVPLGTYLSGGVDSSAVTMLAAELLQVPIHSFCGVFEGAQYDESSHARLVAERAKTIHHEIRPKAADLPEYLPMLAYHMDEPAAGPGIYPQYVVAKEARKFVKVVLTGHGGDEMFGGYARYMVAYLEQCIKGAIFETQDEGQHLVTLSSLIPNLPLLKQYSPMIKEFWGQDVFEPMDARYLRLIDRGKSLRDLVRPEMGASSGERTRTEFRDLFNRGSSTSYFNKMTFFDMRTLLPALLHVEDRVSMSVSLESRVPLLDHRIVELAASMAPLIKFAGGKTKPVLKKALRNVVPNEILDRKDKMGFPFPINRWLKEDIRDFTFDTLTGSRFRQRGWFDVSKVESLLAGEGSFDRGVWGLLNLELWAEAFFDDKLHTL